MITSHHSQAMSWIQCDVHQSSFPGSELDTMCWSPVIIPRQWAGYNVLITSHLHLVQPYTYALSHIHGAVFRTGMTSALPDNMRFCSGDKALYWKCRRTFTFTLHTHTHTQIWKYLACKWRKYSRIYSQVSVLLHRKKVIICNVLIKNKSRLLTFWTVFAKKYFSPI